MAISVIVPDMTMADLKQDCYRDDYDRKQKHSIPEAPSLIRERFLLERTKEKVVLDIGASGPMHESIVRVSSKCYGIDRPSEMFKHDSSAQDPKEFNVGVDLDEIHSTMPIFPGVEIIVCGEVIEHLSNPGYFLQRMLRAYPLVPVIITVPNAFADAGRGSLERGVENVNIDHVAWYSYTTLKTLVTRAGYRIKEHYWYKGRPVFSEGLIFVVQGTEG